MQGRVSPFKIYTSHSTAMLPGRDLILLAFGLGLLCCLRYLTQEEVSRIRPACTSDSLATSQFSSFFAPSTLREKHFQGTVFFSPRVFYEFLEGLPGWSWVRIPLGKHQRASNLFVGIPGGSSQYQFPLVLPFRSLLSIQEERIADNLCIDNNYLNDLPFLRLSTLAPDTIYLRLKSSKNDL